MQRKLTTLMVILIYSGMLLTAQVEKHTLILSGRFNYSLKSIPNEYSFYDDSVVKSYGFSPEAGYLVIDNLMVGFGINYQQSRTKSEMTSPLSGHYETLSRSLAPEIFAKYYKKCTGNLHLALRLGYSYGIEGSYFTRLNNSLNSFSFFDSFNGSRISGFSLAPEIVFFITDSFGVQTNLNGLNIVSINEKKFGLTKKHTEINFNINPSNWEFGLFFKIGKRQGYLNEASN